MNPILLTLLTYSFFFSSSSLFQAPPVKWIISLVAVVTFVLVIIAFALYKAWRYEQELDSLLWKIDLKDVCITDTGPPNKAKVTNINTNTNTNPYFINISLLVNFTSLDIVRQCHLTLHVT